MRLTRNLFASIILGFLVQTLPMSAQEARSLSVRGIVQETGVQTPIAYATILLTDSHGKVSGTTSAEDGHFELKVAEGSCKITVSYIGYLQHTIDLNITETVDLGEILLRPDTKLLSEVVVKTSKPIVKREVDKLVVDAKSLSAVSSNAIDLLKRSPGLLVSEEGAISVLGRGKLIVLINGRESHMTEQELAAHLRSMPSQEIERIEVMTTPPAKYRAEGDAGIVNIVQRKKLSDYFGGTISNQLYASKGQANDLSGSLKYQRGDVFLYANSSCGIGGIKGEQNLEKSYYDKYWLEHSSSSKANKYTSGTLGLEWSLPQNFKTGGHYALLSFSPDRTIGTNVTLTEGLQGTRRQFEGTTHIDRKMLRHNGALFLAKSWGRKSAVLDVDYIHYSMAEREKYRTQGDYLFRYHNEFDRTTDLLQAKMDISIPTKRFKLDFGSSYQYTLTSNNARYLDNPTLPDQYDLFKYREQIWAVYADFMFRPIPKMVSKIGLRGETTLTTGEQHELGQRIEGKQFHLFPTFFFNYNPHPHHVLSFSYGNRIDRPTFAILNPFKRFQNQENLIQGSAHLSPSVSHNMEWGYTFKRNLNLNLSYRNTRNIIDLLPILMADGKVLHTYRNASRSQILSLSSNYRWTPAEWLHITLGAYGYYMYGRSDVYHSSVENKGWSFLTYGIGTIYLDRQKTWVGEVNAQYQSRETYALRTTSPRYYLHTGIKYIALRGKLNVGIQLQNLLSSDNRYRQVSPQGYEIQRLDRSYRTLKLSISYNFGGEIKKSARSQSNHLYNRLSD